MEKITIEELKNEEDLYPLRASYFVEGTPLSVCGEGEHFEELQKIAREVSWRFEGVEDDQGRFNVLDGFDEGHSTWRGFEERFRLTEALVIIRRPEDVLIVNQEVCYAFDDLELYKARAEAFGGTGLVIRLDPQYSPRGRIEFQEKQAVLEPMLLSWKEFFITKGAGP